MQAEAGDVHVVNDLGRVQCGELESEALGMAGLDSGSASTLEELGKALVRIVLIMAEVYPNVA